jgi:3-deoxy-D-manno-octulosonate 8-phosphate phosphatase (KDO 8-P phosphatase)
VTRTTWEERAASIQAVILDVDGVLTDGRLHYGVEGEALKTFHVRDGLGLALLRDAGFRLAIVSGRQSEAVRARARELQISPCLLGRRDKVAALEEVCGTWQLSPAAIAAIGDDLLDVPLLHRVGVGFAPADADAEVRHHADVVLRADGGRGAVREACEILLRATGHWETFRERFELGGKP